MNKIILQTLKKMRTDYGGNEMIIFAQDSDLQVVANEIEKAIDYSQCCEELNHDFKKGDDVWITSKTLVTIADFTECGKRVQVEDGCDYYLVDIDEITKVV